MKKILVPTDFSEGALNALEYALEYAKLFNYGITVFNSFTLPPSGATVMVDITDALRQSSEENLHNLKNHVTNLQLAQGVEIEYKAEHGSVIDVISRLTKIGNYRMVIMGTHGATGFVGKWMGSNTASVTKNLKIPMFAVPVSKRFTLPNKILFTTDFKTLEQTEILNTVKELAARANSRVVFLNVQTEDSKEKENTRALFNSQVKEVFTEVRHSFLFVNDDEIEEGIQSAIDREEPDLLVMIKHEYGFFENLFHSSVTQKIINKALVPMLILKG